MPQEELVTAAASSCFNGGERRRHISDSIERERARDSSPSSAVKHHMFRSQSGGFAPCRNTQRSNVWGTLACQCVKRRLVEDQIIAACLQAGALGHVLELEVEKRVLRSWEKRVAALYRGRGEVYARDLAVPIARHVLAEARVSATTGR